jgi:hypothetical protein
LQAFQEMRVGHGNARTCPRVDACDRLLSAKLTPSSAGTAMVD